MKTKKTMTLVIVTTFIIGLTIGCDSNKKPYEDADALFAEGRYEEAAAAFEALDDYKDSAERAEESQKTNVFSGEGFTITYKILAGDDRESYKSSSENAENASEHYVTILFISVKNVSDNADTSGQLLYVALVETLDYSKMKIWIDGELYSGNSDLLAKYSNENGFYDYHCNIKAPEDFSEMIITYE